MGHDAFISHSTKDKVFADAVCAALERAGVRCWVAPRDILPGESWARSIVHAIGDSRVMVLVFSRHAQGSEHVRREVERAVHHGIAIAPVRVEDVMPAEEMEYYLSSSHWMDAITPPFEAHLNQLAEKVKALLATAGPARRPAGQGPETAQAGTAQPEAAQAETAQAGTALAAPAQAGPAAVRSGRRRAGRIAVVASVGLLVLAAVLFGRDALARLFGHSSRAAGGHPAAAGDHGTPAAPAAQESAGQRGRVAGLLASAKANDSPEWEKAAAAVAAAEEVLRIDPGNDEARALRDRVRGYRRTLTNSLRMRLVEVKPGEFMMGSPPTETWRGDDEAQHRVRLTKGFMMGACEVTRGQFAAFADAAPYKTDAEREGFASVWSEKAQALDRQPGASFRDVGFAQTDDHPVVNVSWNDARAFCDWLSGKEGKKYRLPAEAEWEYAGRAGTTTAYPWGDDVYAGKGWGNLGDQSAAKELGGRGLFVWSDGFAYTAPVGSFRPSAWGLYDMAGNALEWCGDWYDAYRAGDATDPTGPADPPAPDKAWRVLRGGSWYSYPSQYRSACRSHTAPDNRDYFIGFRVCMELE